MEEEKELSGSARKAEGAVEVGEGQPQQVSSGPEERGKRKQDVWMPSLGQALGFSVMTLFILHSGRGSSFSLELGT